jgi:hypothetical protein
MTISFLTLAELSPSASDVGSSGRTSSRYPIQPGGSAYLLNALQRTAIEMLNRHASQVDSIEAANIDRGHRIAVGVAAFSIRMNATRSAKAMLDNVLVERVRADGLFRCEQVQVFARHKPQKRSFTGAHRAIARHRPVELAFYLEGNLATVTATVVLHLSSPLRFVRLPRLIFRPSFLSSPGELKRGNIAAL